jgi:hypothetical protein
MRWLKTLLNRNPASTSTPVPAWQRAADLIAAVDAGGLPLNPARVNDIARHLGLPVSPAEKVADTVNRIRAALAQRRG